MTLTGQEPAQLSKELRQYARSRSRPYYDQAADQKAASAYYRGIAPGADPAAFFDQLSRTLARTHVHQLGYNPSANLYPWVDLHPDGALHSIYSGHAMDVAKTIRQDYWNLQQTGARQSITVAGALAHPETAAAAIAVDEASRAFNCEHVVPQSWFHKSNPMRGDLHHLFACEPSCNSARGNLPYYDFPDYPRAIRSQCGRVDHDANHFEPEAGKGAVARATLYFLLRYPGVIDNYTRADLPTLLKWHHEHPPDLYEKHRNAAIAAVQGDRNPLIDHPEWADSIDFSRGLAS